jgi:prevent-host-death family protein
MAVVNMHEAKTNLSRLVERAAAGEDIVIARNGIPVVRLVPAREANAQRRTGGFDGRIWIADDFDAEDAEISAMFYGESDADQ